MKNILCISIASGKYYDKMFTIYSNNLDIDKKICYE